MRTVRDGYLPTEGTEGIGISFRTYMPVPTVVPHEYPPFFYNNQKQGTQEDGKSILSSRLTVQYQFKLIGWKKKSKFSG